LLDVCAATIAAHINSNAIVSFSLRCQRRLVVFTYQVFVTLHYHNRGRHPIVLANYEGGMPITVVKCADRKQRSQALQACTAQPFADKVIRLPTALNTVLCTVNNAPDR
jgi:hypothetical protein